MDLPLLFWLWLRNQGASWLSLRLPAFSAACAPIRASNVDSGVDRCLEWRCYDKAMLFRFPAFCAALLAVSCMAQTSSTSSAPALRIFQDSALDITLGYPGEFTPVVGDHPASKSGGEKQCVRSILTAGSQGKLGSSAFVVSVIDSACPGVLKQAEQQGSFTREQILRQLKGYGMASLTQEPFRYSIDGRPAAVTLAMAQPDDTTNAAGRKPTYAAKACVLSNIPEKSSGKQNAVVNNEVICLDYTTQNRELLMRLLSFTIKFGDREMHPVVPGNALR